MSSFVGNVYDADDNEIDCKFTFFHYNTNKQSDEKETDDKQFTVDSDDADINDGGASFADGDIAILHFYTDNACSVVKVVGDGSDSYTFDVQLLECQAPYTTIIVNDGTINHDITASSISSDEYQWDYNDITHYHKANWYGKTFCDIGIDKIEYDFGDGYDEKDSYSFDDVDDYDVSVRVTNKCDLQTEDTKTIRVNYNKPLVSISTDNENPIINEDITLSIDNDDVDDTIVSQTYYLDDNEVDELTFNFSKLGTYVFKVVTKWNDSQDDLKFTTTSNIVIINQIPTLDLQYTKYDDNRYIFDANAKDAEDDLVSVKYSIFVEVSSIFETNSRWQLLDTLVIKDDEFLADITFYVSATFKITASAKDGQGGESVVDEVEITTSSNSTASSNDVVYKIVPVCKFEVNLIEEIPTATSYDHFKANLIEEVPNANFVEDKLNGEMQL